MFISVNNGLVHSYGHVILINEGIFQYKLQVVRSPAVLNTQNTPLKCKVLLLC